ncbi:hypothetical protein H8356DRAFT_1026559 [Neocallimastix lanati (nom. inval.)]|nr:hypothetical protein H8356DRAFT_1026559 [Neocallimastix sp. JGI-2020a]
MPTNYEALCQLLEHNHQHHFKSINEMCYGCDKLENNKNVYSEQNETLNEKIEHIQPQNHEHLCSLHALQFYPCLEDNMDIIGELNTYANLNTNVNDKPVNDNKPNIKNFNKSTLNPKSTIVNDLIQQNITMNNINQTNNTYVANNVKSKESYFDKGNSLSMIIPSDFNSNNNNNNNNNLLIQNGQFNSNNENNDLIKNQDDNVNSVYNVLNNLSILNNQKTNQQIPFETNPDPINTLNNSVSVEKQTTDNFNNIYEVLNMKNLNENQQNSLNSATKSYNYILSNSKASEINNLTTYPSSLSIMNNNKIISNLPTLYTKSNSLPIYTQKDISTSSSILSKDASLSPLVKAEIKGELTSSPSHIDISASSVTNNSLLNQSIVSVTNSPSNISYPQPTSSLSTTTYPNSNFSTPTSTNISSSLMTSLSLSNTSTITSSIPSSTLINNNNEEKKLVTIKPKTKEIKSRFTNIARTVAPPLKVNPPKTYVKNSTIRNKSTVLDPEEKRRRNTEASARFRARKKFTEIMLKQQTHDLSCKCCELEKELAEAKREIYWLKQLLIAKQS